MTEQEIMTELESMPLDQRGARRAAIEQREARLQRATGPAPLSAGGRAELVRLRDSLSLGCAELEKLNRDDVRHREMLPVMVQKVARMRRSLAPLDASNAELLAVVAEETRLSVLNERLADCPDRRAKLFASLDADSRALQQVLQDEKRYDAKWTPGWAEAVRQIEALLQA